MGWSRPSGPAGWASAPCGDRPAAGPVGLRPIQALCARKRDRLGPGNKGERREGEEGKEEETAERPTVSDRRWGRSAAGKASAGLKIEGPTT